jgi:sporulation protein YhbH
MIGVRDWSLHRQGPKDEARHRERIRRALKERLPELITEETIVAGPTGARIRVPVRFLEEFYFRYDARRTEHVGQGAGPRQVGDVLLPAGEGDAGLGEGEDRLEVEVSEEELAQVLWEEMGLPRLTPRGGRDLPVGRDDLRDVRRRGPMAAWDRRRTLLANIRRNAREGRGGVVADLADDDLRFRSWREERQNVAQAAVIAIRDVSGSMGEFKKHLSRSFFFWALRFLRDVYPRVALTFICHHTSAREVDEETFFRLGESGGTKVSSAYELCRDLVRARYPFGTWNNYVIHFSDGDNWGEADNRRTLELLTEAILPEVNLFGYAEVRESGRASALMRLFETVEDERFLRVRMAERADVLPALRHFFHVEGSRHVGGT